MNFPAILALDVSGAPNEWINYEEACIKYAKGLVAWELGDPYTVHGGTNTRTGLRTTLDIRTIMAVKGMNKSKIETRIPTLTPKSLYTRDLNICAYCGDTFHHVQLTRDHVHPRSLGGKDIWTNVVTACKFCNNKKGDRLLKDIPDMDLIYLPYAPDRAEALILSNRRILADQMEYLKKIVRQTNSNSRIL